MPAGYQAGGALRSPPEKPGADGVAPRSTTDRHITTLDGKGTKIFSMGCSGPEGPRRTSARPETGDQTKARGLTDRRAICLTCGDYLVFVGEGNIAHLNAPTHGPTTIEHLNRTEDEDHRPDLAWIQCDECCDFCGDTAVAWSYEVLPKATDRRMVLLGTDDDRILDPFATVNDTPWAACSPCSELIEASDWAGLVDQHLRRAKLTGRAVDLAYLLSVAGIQDQFVAMRTGVRTRYEPNRPDPD